MSEQTVFILTAEWGEYEHFISEIRAVFASLEDATSAVERMPELSSETFAAYEKRHAEETAWLKENGGIRPTREDYARCEVALGPRPEFWVDGVFVTYKVLHATLGACHPDLAPKKVWERREVVPAVKYSL